VFLTEKREKTILIMQADRKMCVQNKTEEIWMFSFCTSLPLCIFALGNKISADFLGSGLESNLGSAALSYSITEQGTRMHCALEKKRAFCCSGCRVAEGRRSRRAGSLDGRYQETQTVLFVALVHCFPY